MVDDIDHSARAHSELPPSSADKWLNCYAWRRLMAEIRTFSNEPEPTSAAAEEGTDAHERMEKHLAGTELLDEGYHGFHELMEAIEWVEEQPGELFLEEKVDWGDPFGYHGLTGTVDVILNEPERLTIADLKFGRMVVEHKDNPQLLIYLVGAVARFGRKKSYRIAILQPRAFHPQGTVRVWELEHKRLRKFIKKRLLPAIEGSYHPKSVATTGEHCRKFCDVAGSCRALRDVSLDRFRSTPLEKPTDAKK